MSLGRRIALVGLAGGALAFGSVLSQGVPAAHAAILPIGNFVQIQGSPLTINVSKNTSLQVVDRRVSPRNEFYCPNAPNTTGALGIAVVTGNTYYGPNRADPNMCDGSDWSGAVPYRPITQTFSGTGTSSSPWTVVTKVAVGSGMTLTEVVGYVNGSSSFSLKALFSSTLPVSAKLYTPAEEEAGGSNEHGFPYYNPTTGAVGASNPMTGGTVTECSTGSSPTGPQYYVTQVPLSMPSHHLANTWDAPGANGSFSAPKAHVSYSDLATTTCRDVGSGLEWDGTGTSLSFGENVSFGPAT